VSRWPEHPPFSGRFKLQVDQLEIGAFTEVAGLAVTIEVEEVVEGGQNQFTHKLPKSLKWPNITLKRGITDGNELFKWLASCSGDGLEHEGQVTRRNATISVLDSTGAHVVRAWTLQDAFPVRWTGPRFAASSRDLAVEELELAHHGFAAE
jgi:phage tail-like protein